MLGVGELAQQPVARQQHDSAAHITRAIISQMIWFMPALTATEPRAVVFMVNADDLSYPYERQQDDAEKYEL